MNKFVLVNLVLWLLNITIAISLINFGLNYILASLVGIVLHIIVAFFFHRSWVFEMPKIKTNTGIINTFIVEICIICIMLVSLFVLVEFFGVGADISRPLASIPSGIAAWILHSLFVFGLHPFKR